MASISGKRVVLLKKLYIKDELSAPVIAQRMGESLDAVYYAMRKHKIKRRDPSENGRILFSRKPLSYTLRKATSKELQQLKLAGTLLYWCEGYKTGRSHGVDFANCDVAMLKLFMLFLRNVCGIDENRLRIFIYCHSNSNVEEIKRFWSKELRVKEGQFTKPYIQKNSRVDKQSKMPYGLVHIRYADKKLLWQILDWIEEYKQKLRVDG